MEEKNEIQKVQEQEPLSAYLRKPEMIEKFSMILGNDKDAFRYIQSVILLVETAEPGDYSLKNCTPRSIARCALKAATQKVTVNAEDREAFMIPNRNKAGQLEARFQFHYQEVYNRAMRSGNYRIINVSPIYEGTQIYEDVYTGLHRVVLDNGLPINNESAQVLRKWGEDSGKKRKGWLGYMKDRDGRERTIFLSIEEIERRAQFNKAWSSSFGWKNHREAMEKKTVLLALLRLADLKAKGNEALSEALDVENDDTDETEGEVYDGEMSEETSAPAEPIKHTHNENMSALGFDADEPATSEPETQDELEAAEEQPREEKTYQGNIREYHSELWKKANNAKLITPETAKPWAVNPKMTDTEVEQRCALIEAALKQ